MERRDFCKISTFGTLGLALNAYAKDNLFTETYELARKYVMSYPKVKRNFMEKEGYFYLVMENPEKSANFLALRTPMEKSKDLSEFLFVDFDNNLLEQGSSKNEYRNMILDDIAQIRIMIKHGRIVLDPGENKHLFGPELKDSISNPRSAWSKLKHLSYKSKSVMFHERFNFYDENSDGKLAKKGDYFQSKPLKEKNTRTKKLFRADMSPDDMDTDMDILRFTYDKFKVRYVRKHRKRIDREWYNEKRDLVEKNVSVINKELKKRLE